MRFAYARSIAPAVTKAGKGASLDATIAENVRVQIEQLKVSFVGGGLGGGQQQRTLCAQRGHAGMYRADARLWLRRVRQVSPVLAGLVAEGKLKIVGGVYDLASGKVVEVA